MIIFVNVPVTWYLNVPTISGECWAITWTLTWWRAKRIIHNYYINLFFKSILYSYSCSGLKCGTCFIFYNQYHILLETCDVQQVNKYNTDLSRERERGRIKFVIYWLSQLGLVGIVKHCDLRLEDVALHLKPQGQHFQELWPQLSKPANDKCMCLERSILYYLGIFPDAKKFSWVEHCSE